MGYFLDMRWTIMNSQKRLIELFIYITIVVIGIILLITSNMQNKSENKMLYAGGAYYAVILDK
jgi:hypothetical protein